MNELEDDVVTGYRFLINRRHLTAAVTTAKIVILMSRA